MLLNVLRPLLLLVLKLNFKFGICCVLLNRLLLQPLQWLEQRSWFEVRAIDSIELLGGEWVPELGLLSLNVERSLLGIELVLKLVNNGLQPLHFETVFSIDSCFRLHDAHLSVFLFFMLSELQLILFPQVYRLIIQHPQLIYFTLLVLYSRLLTTELLGRLGECLFW